MVAILLIISSTSFPETPAHAARGPVPWIKASYADLVDRTEMVRTGRTIGEVLGSSDQSSDARGIVQPFLDRYSALLPEMLEMSVRPAMAPYRNVVEYYPVGSAQPAWVAIFRGGRILMQSDGATGVRVFIPGENARASYERWYPVIRHALAGLARGETARGEATGGVASPLRIEVYAYRHRYARSELELNPRAHLVTASRFSVPAGKIPIDLAALGTFFASLGVPDGATIDDDAGLELSPSGSTPATLAGQPVTLADLAVAYRAVCHAGDNEAFISLDPHPDPTRATVSFGGYLEHTHIGSTVLEADKRFKTITCGLDPNTFDDVRSSMARVHPNFFTSAERDMATDAAPSGNWIGTRFWFYPESVEIETDPEYSTAAVTNARFTADAERQRDDFSDPAAFERFKKRSLSASIRDCIADLNRNYDRYASSFNDLAELTNVARLFGICSWLKRGRGAELDLDALLSVTIPAFKTPESKPQMIAGNWVYAPSDTKLTLSLARTRMLTEYLTPLLDQSIREFFGDAAGLEGFLSASAPARRGIAPGEAARMFDRHADNQLRSLVKTKDDLQVIAKLLMQKTARARMEHIRNDATGMGTGLPKLKVLEAALVETRKILQQERDTLARLKNEMAEMERQSVPDRGAYDRTVDDFNARVERHNQLQSAAVTKQNEYGAFVDQLNSGIESFSRQAARSFDVISIGGGINLGPKQFRIKVNPARRLTARRSSSGRTSAANTGDRPGVTAAPPVTPAGTRPTTQGDQSPRALREPVPGRSTGAASSTPRSPATEVADAQRDVARRAATSATPIATEPRASESLVPRPRMTGIVTPLPMPEIRRDDYQFRTGEGSWNDRAVLAPGWIRERTYNSATQTLSIQEATGSSSRRIEAKRNADGKIVFRRAGQ